MHTDSSRDCVLMFHGIGQPGHEMEPDEDLYWIDWPFFDQMVAQGASSGSPRWVFTFDDGNVSDLEAARRLRAAGLRGSFFILAGRLDKPGYLSRDDVREILAMGMEIGLHGSDHIDWRKADEATLRHEIDGSRAALSELCQRQVDTVAIPYGLYDKRVWSYLEASSFRRIYTSDRGLARRGDRFVRRNPVTRDQRSEDVEAIARDAVPMGARIRRAVMPMLKRAV